MPPVRFEDQKREDDKYIVFKRSDFEEFLRDGHLRASESRSQAWVAEHSLEDAVVIRTHDAFASAALHTYANSIAVAARTIGELAPGTRDRLMGIADYFNRRATEADDTPNKLPD